MIKILILALPAMVCAVIALLLTLNVVTSRNKPQVKLLAFMVVSMLLYVAHFIFFNDLIDAIPFSDTIYSFCNPAVYPLFFIYVEELTLKRPNRLHQLLYLLPAIVCFVAVGGLYLMMDQHLLICKPVVDSAISTNLAFLRMLFSVRICLIRAAASGSLAIIYR